jgi:branched-chain amino acid transport system ATP-binding protein
MLLETKNIGISFGSLNALQDVTFHVEDGEIFGIAGPNGAGKSTLYNVISGIYHPNAGKVYFDGNDITHLSPNQICHLGLVRTFQIPATFQSMTVRNNINVGHTFGRNKDRSIDEIIDFLNLKEKSDRLASNLDLYTIKLTMLGATLATGCKLLMLDEPMAGFSIAEIERFLEVIRQVNQEWKVTIVIIEHLLDILIGISNRMMILDNGQVIYIGDPEKVTEDRKVVEVYLGGKVEVERHARS